MNECEFEVLLISLFRCRRMFVYNRPVSTCLKRTMRFMSLLIAAHQEHSSIECSDLRLVRMKIELCSFVVPSLLGRVLFPAINLSLW